MSEKKRGSRFRLRISFRILGRFALTIFIYGVVVALLYVLTAFIGGVIRWDTASWFYDAIILPVYMNYSALAVLAFLVGAAVIFAVYWIRTLGYLESVADATAVAALADEEELVVLPEELKEVEDRLNAIHLQAVRSARSARETEQRKNDLIVYLAHDLKTPLTSVIGYLTLLRDEGQISEELRQKYLSVALDKSERLEDLINEFFEITRFHLSAQEPERSSVDLRRMLEQILFEFKPLMEERNLSYTFEAEDGIHASIDAGKMSRVFDNLIRNAVHYSDCGEVIHVKLTRLGSGIGIVFRNRGIEIPPEKLGRIFEQFYRLDAARSTKSGGAGLGLAIAKEIVELHGGAITAESSGGVTVFTVVLQSADIIKSQEIPHETA